MENKENKKNKKNKYPPYQTSETSLATALVTKGFEIRDLVSINEKTVEFIFDRSPKLLRSVQQYWSEEMFVEPKMYSRNLIDIKDKIWRFLQSKIKNEYEDYNL